MMPEDLSKAIIEAIAASGDENYKRLLMLLLRVEEVFLEEIADLKQQLTVPVQQHTADHQWIAGARESQGAVKATAWKIFNAAAEKFVLIALGAAAGKFFGE